jgi:hypothetical protein
VGFQVSASLVGTRFKAIRAPLCHPQVESMQPFHGERGCLIRLASGPGGRFHATASVVLLELLYKELRSSARTLFLLVACHADTLPWLDGGNIPNKIERLRLTLGPELLDLLRYSFGAELRPFARTSAQDRHDQQGAFALTKVPPAHASKEPKECLEGIQAIFTF